MKKWLGICMQFVAFEALLSLVVIPKAKSVMMFFEYLAVLHVLLLIIALLIALFVWGDSLTDK